MDIIVNCFCIFLRIGVCGNFIRWWWSFYILFCDSVIDNEEWFVYYDVMKGFFYKKFEVVLNVIFDVIINFNDYGILVLNYIGILKYGIWR